MEGEVAELINIQDSSDDEEMSLGIAAYFAECQLNSQSQEQTLQASSIPLRTTSTFSEHFDDEPKIPKDYILLKEINLEDFNDALIHQIRQETRHPTFINDPLPLHLKNACHSTKYYPCTWPNCSFSSKLNEKYSLEVHVKSHLRKKELLDQIEGPKFLCKKCHQIYTSVRSLAYHLRNVHNTFMCLIEDCGKRFRTPSSLKLHVLSHKTEKVKCQYCEKFYPKSGIRNHIIQGHKKERGWHFKCDECGDTFVLRRNLEIHTQKNHMKNN